MGHVSKQEPTLENMHAQNMMAHIASHFLFYEATKIVSELSLSKIEGNYD